MFFWNIDGLKAQILKGQFTDGRVFPYIIISTGGYALLIDSSLYAPYEVEEINHWTYLLSALNFAIVLWGTFHVYRANGGAGGQNFAAKFVGIGFVLGIRFLVYALPLFAGLMIYWFTAYGDDEYIPTSFPEVVVFVAWYVVYFLRMAKHIRDTAEPVVEPA